MTGACMRCAALSDALLAHGALTLCPQCPLLAPCAPWQHPFRGSQQAGILVCTDCGTTLGASAISTEPVKVPEPVPDYFC